MADSEDDIDTIGTPAIVRSSPSNPRFTRREMLFMVGGAGFGATVGAVGATVITRRGRPFPRMERIATVVDVQHQLDHGPMLVADDSIAIVGWDPSIPYPGGRAMDVYGPSGQGHPVLSETSGLMALLLRSTHLGCRVQWCQSSEWFEDPCHGSKWGSPHFLWVVRR